MSPSLWSRRSGPFVSSCNAVHWPGQVGRSTPDRGVTATATGTEAAVDCVLLWSAAGRCDCCGLLCVAMYRCELLCVGCFELLWNVVDCYGPL